MAGSVINATKYLSRQGIDPKMVYEASVVNNFDQRKLCRIQARIKGIFDGIGDADLPWAIPEFNHPDGAYNDSSGKAVDRSGMGFVPKKGHKVGLKFPTGDPHRPVWTSYTVDEQVALPEYQDVNYPDRVVFKLSNGFYVIIDTRTNEVIINNPGDVDMTILGDVNQYIVGNQQLTVTDNKGEIAGYLLNAPETVLKSLSPKPAKRIPFQGLLSKGYAGNQHTTIKGDQTTTIMGNRKTVVHGNDLLQVGRIRYEKVTILHRIEAPRSETNG